MKILIVINKFGHDDYVGKLKFISHVMTYHFPHFISATGVKVDFNLINWEVMDDDSEVARIYFEGKEEGLAVRFQKFLDKVYGAKSALCENGSEFDRQNALIDAVLSYNVANDYQNGEVIFPLTEKLKRETFDELLRRRDLFDTKAGYYFVYRDHCERCGGPHLMSGYNYSETQDVDYFHTNLE